MENNTAKVIKAIGIVIIIAGLIASIICGKGLSYDERDNFNSGVFLAVCLGGTLLSAVSGIILYGFGETISLLDASTRHLNNIENKVNGTQQ